MKTKTGPELRKKKSAHAGKSRLFRRTESAPRSEPVEFPSSFGVPSAGVTEVRPPPKPFVGLQAGLEKRVVAQSARLAKITKHPP